MTPSERAEYRHQVHVCIRDLIGRWNERAQVLHHGHIIDLSAILTEAIVHPNSIIKDTATSLGLRPQ